MGSIVGALVDDPTRRLGALVGILELLPNDGSGDVAGASSVGGGILSMLSFDDCVFDLENNPKC